MTQDHKLSFTRLFLRWAAIPLIVISLPCVSISGQNKDETELQISKCWEHPVERSSGRIAADNENVYTVRDGSMLEAVSIDTGKRLWATDIGGAVDSDLVAADGSVFLVRRPMGDSGSTNALLALSGTTGITRWNYPAHGSGGSVLKRTGLGLLSVSADGEMTLVSMDDGSVKWTRKLGTNVNLSTIAISGTMVAVGYGSRVFLSELGSDSSETVDTGKYEVSSIGIGDELRIYAGDERGALTSFEGESAVTQWSFRSGGRITGILANGGDAYAASNDNFVYALDGSSGDRTWKRRVAGRIAAISPLDDKTLLVQPLGEGNILLIDAESGRIAGQIVPDAKESVVSAATAGGDRVLVLTNRALYLYRIGKCGASK